MKSVKPGRGPSFMGGITGILVGLFGVGWTVAVLASGGGAFALFGVIFVAIAVVNAVYNFKNATGKNRYSSFDITEDGEEPDPWNERFSDTKIHRENRDGRYCPYCGKAAGSDFEYCTACGKKLP